MTPAPPPPGLTVDQTIALWTMLGGWFAGLVAIGVGVLAYRSFRKQASQVDLMKTQLSEQQQYNRDQLDLLREQLRDQQQANKAQADALALQGNELRAAAEERQREAQERHYGQARRVYLSCTRETEGGNPPVTTYTAVVQNGSPLPIRRIRLLWHTGTGPWHENGFDFDEWPALYPEDQKGSVRDWAEGGNLASRGVTVKFDDYNGTRWLLRENGELVEWTGEG